MPEWLTFPVTRTLMLLNDFYLRMEVVEDLPCAIVIKAPDGRLLYANGLASALPPPDDDRVTVKSLYSFDEVFLGTLHFWAPVEDIDWVHSTSTLREEAATFASSLPAQSGSTISDAMMEQMAWVGLMASGTAHEMRNLLAGVQGFLQVLAQRRDLLQKQGVINQDQWPELDFAMRELERAGNLSRNLLTAARPKDQTEHTVLSSFIEDFMPLLFERCKQEGVHFAVEASNPDATVKIDHARLQQVILNLCLNALDFLRTRDDGKIHIEFIDSDGGVEIRVNDNGPGILPEHLDQLFNTFFTTKNNGSGLGLAISRQIIEAHGGKIEARNNEEGGASFYVWLPTVEGESVSE